MAPRTKGRVVLSTNPKENLDVATKLYNKHLSLGKQSPLTILQDVNWEATGPTILEAMTNHEKAEDAKQQSEKYYATRDKMMPEITNALKKSIALLKASFGNNPKQLIDWGISIDDSPKVKPTKESLRQDKLI